MEQLCAICEEIFLEVKNMRFLTSEMHSPKYNLLEQGIAPKIKQRAPFYHLTKLAKKCFGLKNCSVGCMWF